MGSSAKEKRAMIDLLNPTLGKIGLEKNPEKFQHIPSSELSQNAATQLRGKECSIMGMLLGLRGLYAEVSVMIAWLISL